MLPPPFIPGKARVRRKRHTPTLAPLPPPASVSVLAVNFNDASVLEWEFSSYVASWAEHCPQLQADDLNGGGMRSPTIIQFDGENRILAQYDDADFSAGFGWQVLAPPAGIVFVDGTLVVPESGEGSSGL